MNFLVIFFLHANGFILKTCKTFLTKQPNTEFWLAAAKDELLIFSRRLEAPKRRN